MVIRLNILLFNGALIRNDAFYPIIKSCGKVSILKRFSIGWLVCACTSTTPFAVLAADLPSYREPPTPPVYEPLQQTDWSGFYVGAYGGAIWSEGDIKNTDTIPQTQPSYSTNGKGGFNGGVYGGYNYQPANLSGLVVGIEADVGYSGAKADMKLSSVPNQDIDGKSEVKWTGSVRGRVGFDLNGSTFVYGTAGVGFGGVDQTVYRPSDYLLYYKRSKTDWGWIVGAGVEGKVTENIMLRGEYLYGQLTDTKTDTHQGRFGVSYKF